MSRSLNRRSRGSTRPAWPHSRTGSRPIWYSGAIARSSASWRGSSDPTPTVSGSWASSCSPSIGAGARPTRSRRIQGEEALADELGLEPGRELRTLEQRILTMTRRLRAGGEGTSPHPVAGAGPAGGARPGADRRWWRAAARGGDRGERRRADWWRGGHGAGGAELGRGDRPAQRTALSSRSPVGARPAGIAWVRGRCGSRTSMTRRLAGGPEDPADVADDRGSRPSDGDRDDRGWRLGGRVRHEPDREP